MMQVKKLRIAGFIIMAGCTMLQTNAQVKPVLLLSPSRQVMKGERPIAHFNFEGNTNNTSGNPGSSVKGKSVFVKGLEGKALSFRSGAPAFVSIESKNLPFAQAKDFTIQCWVKTTMDKNKTAVLLSQKDFHSNSLAAQKNPGWVLYFHGGTWAWNMGSGKRRITHERDNGNLQPLNDDRWHQLTMAYNSREGQVRLYYDGVNKAIYDVQDSVGFNFTSTQPLNIGADKTELETKNGILTEIHSGADLLQQLVDAFNALALQPVQPGELETLVVEPKVLFDEKVRKMKTAKGSDSTQFAETVKGMDFAPVTKARSELMKNAYTIHQVRDFMKVAPLLKIYSLTDGKIKINEAVAKKYTEKERLSVPDFSIDNLTIWDRTVSPEEVISSYAKHFKPDTMHLKKQTTEITTAVWNIHHGGKHNTIEKDGWDSRKRIAEMLRNENADVIMMQETYSSGDYIAAELGYYFATTVDWDYLNQGANISVLSRYPFREVYVPDNAPFMNVSVKVALSESQDMYVMSNWYGMQQFPAVYRFNEFRFQESDEIPAIFAGDFNAAPHTDGDRSPASVKLLENGFTDAYRALNPDVKQYPGYTHQSNRRIDQLYYKGRGLKNTSMKVINSWPAGFPSDHFLMVAKFKLDYATGQKKTAMKKLD